MAARAPSGGNLQPWYVDVVAGGSLEELKEIVRSRLSAGLQQPEFAVYPTPLDELYHGRRKACGEALYDALNIEPTDKPGRWRQFLRNYELFGAPVGLFFSIDRSFDRPQWVHLGMFMQTLMLLAAERGLGTCAQESWAAIHGPVAGYLGLPAGRILYAGMALGWPDEAHPVNCFRTDRESVDQFARFHA